MNEKHNLHIDKLSKSHLIMEIPFIISNARVKTSRNHCVPMLRSQSYFDSGTNLEKHSVQKIIIIIEFKIKPE